MAQVSYLADLIAFGPLESPAPWRNTVLFRVEAERTDGELRMARVKAYYNVEGVRPGGHFEFGSFHSLKKITQGL